MSNFKKIVNEEHNNNPLTTNMVVTDTNNENNNEDNNKVVISSSELNLLKNAGKVSISSLLSSLDEYHEILKGQMLDVSNSLQTTMGVLAHAIETMNRHDKVKQQIQERLKQDNNNGQ